MNADKLIQRYTRAADRAADLLAANRPRAARRWLRRAGGIRAALYALGVMP